MSLLTEMGGIDAMLCRKSDWSGGGDKFDLKDSAAKAKLRAQITQTNQTHPKPTVKVYRPPEPVEPEPAQIPQRRKPNKHARQINEENN